MQKHKAFRFKSLRELEAFAIEIGADMNFSEDLSPLFKPVPIGSKTASNAMSVLPMEGCDSEADGSPSELVRRRYLRFASGGYGLIWWEACAVTEEGRANPHQMMITGKNLSRYASILSEIRETTLRYHGFVPINILQLTHSGRYSRPYGHETVPIVTQRDPLLDTTAVTATASDEYLAGLVPKYVQAAKFALAAGFDGVDVKCCHRYLLSELLASHTRRGQYGGCFKNRTRLILDIIKAIKRACGGELIIACRFNAFDAHPYPYGFGCGRNDMWSFDPVEPLKLVSAFRGAGVDLLSCTAGNPYYKYPQITRPGGNSEGEHPLRSVARLFAITGEIQKAAGTIPVVGSGYSWLRQYLPYAAAANLAAGNCSFVGFGRMAFAYPDAPSDIKSLGHMVSKKCCAACGMCTQIMRDHGKTGCVAKDAEIYQPLYKKYRASAEERRRAEGAGSA